MICTIQKWTVVLGVKNIFIILKQHQYLYNKTYCSIIFVYVNWINVKCWIYFIFLWKSIMMLFEKKSVVATSVSFYYFPMTVWLSSLVRIGSYCLLLTTLPWTWHRLTIVTRKLHCRTKGHAVYAQCLSHLFTCSICGLPISR